MAGCARAAIAALVILVATTAAAAAPARDCAGPLRQAHDQTVGHLRLLGGTVISPELGVRGLSGLELEGDTAIMVSDLGAWVTTTLAFGADGRLAGLGPLTSHELPQQAEAIRRRPAGGYVVSFEATPPVRLYAGTPDTPAVVPDLPEALTRRLGAGGMNAGIEAIAAIADGGYVALVEGPDPAKHPRLAEYAKVIHGAVVDAAGKAREISYVADWYPAAAPDSTFRPTDLALLPDGDLLLLERYYTPTHKSAVQLRRIPLAQVRAGGTVTPVPLARLVPPFPVDNFEGLAVQRRDGRTLVYVVVDDNRNATQCAYLLQFELLP